MTTTIHQPANLILSGRDLARGARLVAADELSLVQVPASTQTWHPVPYATLVEIAKDILGNSLPGDYELVDEGFILAQRDQQLFGALTYKSATANLPFAVGLRSSYNQTLSAGVCMGGRVTVCSNLMFSGLLRVLRKQTKNVLTDLKDLLFATVKQAATEHKQLIADAASLFKARCSDKTAYQIMGVAWGHGLIGDRQLPVVKQEWLTPSFPEFKRRNQWSLYNAFTHALKTTHPSEMMERLIALHKLFMG
jgi:hypothetical protein